MSSNVLLSKGEVRRHTLPDCANCPNVRFGIYSSTQKTVPGQVESLRTSVVTYENNQTILRQGQSSRNIGSLRSGWAYAHKTLEDGRRHIKSFLLPGDAVVLDLMSIGANPLPYGITALTAASVCWFPTERMTHLLQNDKDQRKETQFWMSYYVSTMSLRTAMIGHSTATARLAEFILELFTRLRYRDLTKGDGYEFPPTQPQIADCLGLTPAYVSMTLTNLRKRGILEIRDRTIKIFDERELYKIANGQS
jgi:CRP/FNR family transcriptional regulator